MPNPLTDELTPEAKAELAAIFADLKRLYARYDEPQRDNRPAWLRGWDRPHEYTRRGW